MTNDFNSTLSWLDSSESERRAVMELVSALNEPGTLDELGIGSIRDTLADALFPGTSTIQTRARYFLFVPWILQMVEAAPGANPDRRARELQLKLCDALDESHGPRAGVIGRQARGSLRRWPSSIYWVGLEQWGIRRQAAASPSYAATLQRPSALQQATSLSHDPLEGRGYESTDRMPGRWAALPPVPPDFPEKATFNLTPEEGRFLWGCIEFKHHRSYLSHILRESSVDDIQREGYVNSLRDANYLWEHFSAGSATPALAAWIDDAKLFSLVHQGAAILYNLMLAELLQHDECRENFLANFAVWLAHLWEAQDNLVQWDRPAMWRRLQGANPRLRAATIAFADRWHDLAMKITQPPLDPTGNAAARHLVREREHALKGMRARLTYAEARDMRRGYPTSGRLDFRWFQVKQIVTDILKPLETS